MTNQRQLDESGAAAVQLMCCWPTSQPMQETSIVINRIPERDEGRRPINVAAGPYMEIPYC